MSFDGLGVDWTFTANSDLSASQYRFVKLVGTNAGGFGLVDLCVAGDKAIGVLMDAPTAGLPARVRVYGIAKVVASGALAVPSHIASDASGKAKAAVNNVTNTSDAGSATDPVLGSNVIGELLAASTAAGDIVPVLLTHSGAIPTTIS